MSGKIYSLIFFIGLFWFFCLYVGFKNEKKIVSPVDFFLFGRQLPGWSYAAIFTSTIFALWIFFIHPSLIFLNGFPFAVTSLFVIALPLIGALFSKRQWMLSKRYGFVTPSEMFGTYFKSEIVRALIVLITLGFAIPFISIQLSLGGLLISILSDNIIGSGSAALLIGGVISIYLALGGIRSIIYIDSVQFLFFVFGIICIGFITYDLVGGWDLLNESLSRISNVKENLFNIKESYKSYLAVPGTIKTVNIINDSFSYGGIWTISMILTFVFALCGIQMSPNASMLIFSSKDVNTIGSQQIWFSGFLIGFLLMFFTIAIGVGSILLGGNSIINESGNNLSNVLPSGIFPNEIYSLVPHLINLIGEYSFIFFGILVVCALAAIQSVSAFYLSTSAIFTRDILKRFFIRGMNNKEQIFFSRIVLLFIFIFALSFSVGIDASILDIGSFSLAIACQMFVPLLAICYIPWFTKQGVSFGIVVGIIAVFLTDGVGQVIFRDVIIWNKWPLTIHSSFWGVFFNLIGTITISFITQENKENNHRQKFHDFINDHKDYSIWRRSLKPSAWIVFVAWIFFALGPGLIISNQLFGNPSNVESWSFGMPSLWVWKVIFWLLGILLIWFLSSKMEMSTSTSKTIVSQTDDIGGSFKG